MQQSQFWNFSETEGLFRVNTSSPRVLPLKGCLLDVRGSEKLDWFTQWPFLVAFCARVRRRLNWKSRHIQFGLETSKLTQLDGLFCFWSRKILRLKLGPELWRRLSVAIYNCVGQTDNFPAIYHFRQAEGKLLRLKSPLRTGHANFWCSF